MKKVLIVLLSILLFCIGVAGGCAMKNDDQGEVPGPGEEEIRVEKVELSQTGLELNGAETAQLTVKFLPEGAEPVPVSWTTSDGDVAAVTEGTVVAEGRGSAVVRVQTADGISAECAVNVRDTETFVTVANGDSINAAIAGIGVPESETVTVKLRSGTYREDVVIDRPNVILEGAASGKSVIVPGTVQMPGSKLNPDRQNLGVIAVAADHVTVRNLTVDGDNPELNYDLDFLYEGKVRSGMKTDAFTGIFTRVKKLSYSADEHLAFQATSVENCDIRNVFYAGISLSAKHSPVASEQNVLTGNRISGTVSTQYGYGIELDKNVFAEIEDNTITGVQNGITVSVLNLEGEGVIAGNTIETLENGILIGQVTADCGYDVNDNEILATSGSFGLAYLTCTKDDCREMKAVGNRISGFDNGVHVYNSNRKITIEGGKVELCGTGLYLSDASTSVAGGVPISLVDVLNVSCNGGAFSDCEQAVHVFSNQSRNNSLLLSGGTISDCEQGLVAEVGNGASAIINVVGTVTFRNVESEEVAIGAGQINRS